MSLGVESLVGSLPSQKGEKDKRSYISLVLYVERIFMSCEYCWAYCESVLF